MRERILLLLLLLLLLSDSEEPIGRTPASKQRLQCESKVGERDSSRAAALWLSLSLTILLSGEL